MGPCIFSAIALFSLLSCHHIHAAKKSTKELTKDEKAYVQTESSKFFNNLQYELEVNTDVVTYHQRFWGHVLITMKCIQKTNRIFLDRHLIDIDAKTVKVWKYKKLNSDKRKEITVHYARNVNEEEGYKIKLESYMKENSIYKVRLEFSRHICTGNYGFVCAYYRLTHPNVRHVLFTSMKKNFAHHIFPCFNEIDMKAIYKIKIGHLKNVKSFTNAKFVTSEIVDNPNEFISHLNDHNLEQLKSTFGRNEDEEIADDKRLPKIWVVDEFAKTDSISTFSVGLAVVDFDSYGPATLNIGPPNTNLSEVKILVWAERDLLNDLHLKEVQRVAAQSLAFFSKFFQSTYNVGKLDVIVLPDDQITVEDSYGLIYLGEKMVKYVFSESTRYREDRHFLVSKICQASSRQWLGHLVTQSKWHEEWFFEGLHTYLQRHCILELFEDWKVNVQLDLLDSFIDLLRAEERGRDHDPVFQIGDSNSFNYLLNHETRLKIYLVIRMVSFIMDVKKQLFQKGLANLISEFASSNPSLSQLWNSWTQTVWAETDADMQILFEDTRITLEHIIKSWMCERGHPLMIVSRNKAKNVITVTQKAFAFPNQNEFERCWFIPFDIIIKPQGMSSIKKMRKWLTCSHSSVEFTVADANKDDWIIVSLGLHVPGRVHYELDNWLLIKKLFRDEEEIIAIDKLTRIQLIHDMFTLASASYLDYDFVFETMKYITHEKDFGCWHVVSNELDRVRSRWTGTNLFEPLQKFVRSLIQPIFENKIGTIDEFLKSGSKHYVKKMIIKTACTFELSDCEEYSQSLLKNMMTRADSAEGIQIPESLIEIFYCNAMKNADEKTWDFLLAKYKKDPADSRILRALGCSKNTLILKKYLKWSTDVNNSDTSARLALEVFKILASSSEGYQLIIRYFVKRRWGIIKNKKLKALTEFLSKFKENITIHDFLIKALEGTNKQTNLNVLQTFSNTLRGQTWTKLNLENEASSIASRTISWFENKAKKLSEYFSQL